MKALALMSVVIVLGFVGCAPPEIVPISGNVYIISVRTPGNGDGTKAEILRKANEFAESKGKAVLPISFDEWHPSVGFGGKFDYQFKLVDKDSPEAQNQALVPRPNMVIEKSEKVTADIKTKDTTEKKPDMYTELIKLDDLRKRGIITEAEFEAQKKKLLEGK